MSTGIRTPGAKDVLLSSRQCVDKLESTCTFRDDKLFSQTIGLRGTTLDGEETIPSGYSGGIWKVHGIYLFILKIHCKRFTKKIKYMIINCLENKTNRRWKWKVEKQLIICLTSLDLIIFILIHCMVQWNNHSLTQKVKPRQIFGIPRNLIELPLFLLKQRIWCWWSNSCWRYEIMLMCVSTI